MKCEPMKIHVELAFKPITMHDIRLHAGEGKLSAHDVLAAANAVMRSRTRDAVRAAAPPPLLAAPAPVEGLPEGCPETAMWGSYHGHPDYMKSHHAGNSKTVHEADEECADHGCVTLRLSRLEREAKKGEG